MSEPVTEQRSHTHLPRRIALACDTSEHTRHAFVWCLSQLCHPKDVLVLIHVSTRAEEESHDPYSPAEPSAEQGAELTESEPDVDSLDGARSRHDTESEHCSLSGGWQVLMKYIQICKQAQLQSMAVLTRGDAPASSFVEAAAAHDCDLAVVGSRCLGAFKRALSPSFSTHTLNAISFPIVVVRWGIQSLDANLLNLIPAGLGEEEGTSTMGRRASVPEAQSPERRLSASGVSLSSISVAQVGRALSDNEGVMARAVSETRAMALGAHTTAEVDDSEPLQRVKSGGSEGVATGGGGGGVVGDSLLRAASGGSEGQLHGHQQQLQHQPAAIAHLSRALRASKKRRIGVGVDPSSGSKAALRWVIENYYLKGDVILLVHCQPLLYNPGAGYGAGSTYMAMEKKAKEEGIKVLRKYSRLCQRAGVKCVQIIARGDPKCELVEVAEKHRCDLTVVGATGATYDRRKSQPAGLLGGFLQALFSSSSRAEPLRPPAHEDIGSVCNAVVHRIHVPIVVVRRKHE